MTLTYEIHQIKTEYLKFSNYCYIVADKATKNACLVDPAWEIDKIVNKLQELEANLAAILLTHSHYDHTNLVNTLIKKFNPSVFMSKTEIDYYGYRCTNLNDINDLDELEMANTRFKCLLTPGHTKGGMCYLLEDSIFTGDTVFIEGCGICTSNGGSPEEMYNSIQRIKALVSPHVRIYPSHAYAKEPGYTLSYVANENIYFLCDNKEHFIKFRMRKNQKEVMGFDNIDCQIEKNKLEELF